VQTDALKDTFRRDTFAGRIARAGEAERSTMRVSCSWQRPTVKQSSGWNLMIPMIQRQKGDAMVFTKDEKTLLILYGEKNRSGTLKNLFLMREQLQTDEKALSALTDAVIWKLGGMTDAEFDDLNLLGVVRSGNAGT